jgi:hypothetical protein
MPLKRSPKEVMDDFDKSFDYNNMSNIDRKKLSEFIDANFYQPTYELQNCTPPDWKPTPSKIMQIQDPLLRNWALDLNNI